MKTKKKLENWKRENLLCGNSRKRKHMNTQSNVESNGNTKPRFKWVLIAINAPAAKNLLSLKSMKLTLKWNSSHWLREKIPETFTQSVSQPKLRREITVYNWICQLAWYNQFQADFFQPNAKWLAPSWLISHYLSIVTISEKANINSSQVLLLELTLFVSRVRKGFYILGR